MSGTREARRPTAIEFGIGLVAARSWPEKKIREKIAARYDEAEVETAVARLRELRLVDDAAWAERYVRDRFERVGKGRHRIRMELLTRGIDAVHVDAALAAVLDVDSERQRAAAVLEALRRNLARGAEDPELAEKPRGASGRRAPSAAETLKNRLFRRMLARGYPSSLVRDLLDVS